MPSANTSIAVQVKATLKTAIQITYQEVWSEACVSRQDSLLFSFLQSEHEQLRSNGEALARFMIKDIKLYSCKRSREPNINNNSVIVSIYDNQGHLKWFLANKLKFYRKFDNVDELNTFQLFFINIEVKTFQ